MGNESVSAPSSSDHETDFSIGPQAIAAYRRLSYTMWHALGEFIDNSTQSRLNYDGVIRQVLQQEGTPLVVDITYNRLKREITISDNSIGMGRDRLIEALRIAVPTVDSKGRSRFGMGMKTAACWIGNRWKVVTSEWASDEEWTAEIDVNAIAGQGARIPLTRRTVDTDSHYTKIIIADLNRNFQAKTEETIRGYIGSMYRFDLERGDLKLVFNGEEVKPPEAYDFDTDPEGKTMRMDLPPVEINGKKVTGWIGVLRKGGRRYGGFSLFQNERQIQGFPNAWKPRAIYGGVDDEGANNLVSQRLVGILNFDNKFHVSHTKDAISFEADEEEELEKFLVKITEDYRNYAQRRRGPRAQAWNREKLKDLIDSMKSEFTSAEMKDAVDNAMLPPLNTIIENNEKQVASLTVEDQLATIQLAQDLKIVISLKEISEFEPHLTIQAGADPGTLHVIINGLHPYYMSIESADAIDECIRQYIYDAVAEYKTSKLNGALNPNSVRRLKNDLLKAESLRVENAAERLRTSDVRTRMNAA
jgi:hypothetical protein